MSEAPGTGVVPTRGGLTVAGAFPLFTSRYHSFRVRVSLPLP